MKKTNKSFLFSFVVLILIFSRSVFSCSVVNESSIYPQLPDGDSFITFHKEIIEDISINDYQIMLSHDNCNVQINYKIDTLPYFNSPGKIKSAFIDNKNKDKNIYIIHGTEVAWHDGEPYGYASDFFDISVYKYINDKYIFDERASQYFGRGSDLFDIKSSDQKTVYSFPYKSKESILKSINSDIYKNWMLDKETTATINQKSFLYLGPRIHSVTKKYLIAGDEITITEVNSGWIKIRYKNKIKNIIIDGWIKQKNANSK